MAFLVDLVYKLNIITFLFYQIHVSEFTDQQ